AQRRRLATAGRSEDADELAAAHIEAQAIIDLLFAQRDADILECNDRVGAHADVRPTFFMPWRGETVQANAGFELLCVIGRARAANAAPPGWRGCRATRGPFPLPGKTRGSGAPVKAPPATVATARVARSGKSVLHVLGGTCTHPLGMRSH